jgi:DNA replication protein DnaC
MQVLNLVKPKMEKVKMMCDECIDNKMTKYPAVDCAFSQCNFTLICGKMGQGKTSLLISLIKKDAPLYHCYHHIYTIIPEISLHSISKKDNVFVNNIKPEYLYHEYNEEVLDELFQKLEGHAQENEYSLLCIDDMGALFKKDKRALVILNRIITKMRHLKTTVFLLCQNIYQLPKTWREIATNLITYNLGKSQMGKIFAEFYDYKDEQFRQIMKLYKNPHDWLLLNLKYNRLFFKFDKEIVFDEEDKTDDKM